MRLCRNGVLVALAAMLAACGLWEEDAPPPNPPFFEITNSNGEVEGWLLGTIHALPEGAHWRTPAIDTAIAEADLLLVEVAELEDQARLAAAFGQLATTPGLGPVSARISPDLRDQFGIIMDRAGASPNEFTAMEDWAVAMRLARVDAHGDPRYGVDRAVIREFAQGTNARPVRGFETGKGQMRIFDELAPEDQRALLEGTIREWAATQEQPDRLTAAWRNGNDSVLQEVTTTGTMADPELRDAILTGRNRNWMVMLALVLPTRERPLVAVGAAHLLGEDSLPALLLERGYQVTRVQPANTAPN